MVEQVFLPEEEVRFMCNSDTQCTARGKHFQTEKAFKDFEARIAFEQEKIISDEICKHLVDLS